MTFVQSILASKRQYFFTNEIPHAQNLNFDILDIFYLSTEIVKTLSFVKL